MSDNTKASNNNNKSDKNSSKSKKQGRGKKEIMIECKTFLFRPSGNGTVNFAYRLVADSAAVKESEKHMEMMKEQYEAQSADAKKEKKDKSGSEKEADSINMIMSLDPVKAIMPAEMPEPTTPVKKTSPKIEPPSTPTKSTLKRRKLTVLPTIEEEEDSDSIRAEKEKRFYDEFCEGQAPPPESEDDWTAPNAPIKRSSLNVSELERLGFLRKLDSNGVMRVYVTPEAQTRAMNSPEYQWYKRMLAANKLTPNKDDATVTCTVSCEEFARIKSMESQDEKAVMENNKGVNQKDSQKHKQEDSQEHSVVNSEIQLRGSKRTRRS